MNTKRTILITTGVILLGLVAALWAGLLSQQHASADLQAVVPEIQREQAVREVEVSVWETCNAIFYYMTEPSAISLEEYHKQLIDVEHFMEIYTDLVTEGPELQMIAEFNQHWQTSISRAERLILLRNQLQSASHTLWNDIHDLEQMIQNESLLVLSGTPSQIQTKKLLLQKVATNVWEITRCLNFSIYSTGSEIEQHFKAHEKTVIAFLEQYQALGLTEQEKDFTDSLHERWNQYLKQLHQGSVLSQDLKQQSLSFWESIHEVDDIIDFEMQEEFKSHLNTRLAANIF